MLYYIIFEENIFFCKTDIDIKIYTIKKGEENYLFLKSNVNTVNIIDKMNKNLVSSKSILTGVSEMKLNILLDYLQKMSNITMVKLKKILSKVIT